MNGHPTSSGGWEWVATEEEKVGNSGILRLRLSNPRDFVEDELTLEPLWHG